jgi:hypothetical protein
VVYENTTNSTLQYSFLGASAADGLPSILNQIHTTSNGEDVLWDLTNPKIIKAVYPNGTSMTYDTINGRIIYNDCTIQLSFPFNFTLPAQNLKKRAPIDQRSSELTGSVDFSVYLANQCGDPLDNELPSALCSDTTPEYSLYQAPPKYVGLHNDGNGKYSGSCTFRPAVAATPATCGIVGPALQAFCDIRGAAGSTAAAAQTICIGLAAFGAEVPAFVCEVTFFTWFVYCGFQKIFDINGQLEEALCHATPLKTDLQVTLTDPGTAAPANLGQFSSSNNPGPIQAIWPNQPPSGATCSPCSGGNRWLSTPWSQVYAGNLFISNSYDCNGGYLTSGAIPAGSLGDADAQCRALAEQYRMLILIERH